MATPTPTAPNIAPIMLPTSAPTLKAFEDCEFDADRGLVVDDWDELGVEIEGVV